MKTEGNRICPSCGTAIAAAWKFCPVCMLQEAVVEDFESGEFSETAIEPENARGPRFDNYELLTDAHGQVLELGRGGMGVTYKAMDVALQIPVTLKLISEKLLGDEPTRLRFLREARMAASVRHPNVASVFHLGRAGQNYFYAMEFVEGETLENLIRRSGTLEMKLALDITRQVGAGLVAVHKRKLVHRDIKPSNIMVSFEEEGAVAAKIIDLGLAKPTQEAPTEGAISTPGAFAGTPQFASPEQFAGVGVDIRSDLYSLGGVLWQMVTGQSIFSGTTAEMMHQHLNSPPPLEQLEAVPQPVAVLLSVLLEKDPGRRFQDPAELIGAIEAISRAIDARRKITRRGLQKKTVFATRQLRPFVPPARSGPKKISVARLPVTGSDLLGREEEIAFLDAAWANPGCQCRLDRCLGGCWQVHAR